MSYALVLALVPPADDGDPPLPLLRRARLLLYPYVYRGTCREHGLDEEGCVRCSCAPWDDAIVGRRDVFRGYLWRDRYGRLLPGHPVAGPEDEPRPAEQVQLRYAVPAAIVTPDGEAHYPGGSPDSSYTVADCARLDDLITKHSGCMVVPFSCHC